MRYEGAIYSRTCSNDTQTLYLCTGDDVRHERSEPCDGKVAFELREIYGELVEQRIRLIGYTLHSHW